LDLYKATLGLHWQRKIFTCTLSTTLVPGIIPILPVSTYIIRLCSLIFLLVGVIPPVQDKKLEIEMMYVTFSLVLKSLNCYSQTL
jgi:hypothetical protein